MGGVGGGEGGCACGADGVEGGEEGYTAEGGAGMPGSGEGARGDGHGCGCAEGGVVGAVGELWMEIAGGGHGGRIGVNAAGVADVPVRMKMYVAMRDMSSEGISLCSVGKSCTSSSLKLLQSSLGPRLMPCLNLAP